MSNAKTYRRCPECGSGHYERSATRDITYTHTPGEPTKREVTNPDMPWWFKCLECGFHEGQW